MKQISKALASLAFALLVPALALADEHGGGHGEHAGWDVNALIASFVNFFVLISLFIYLFRDGLNSYLKSRRAAIEGELSEAARLRAEAETKHKEYTARLATLDQELEQIKRDMIAAGQKERDRIVAEAEEKAARMRKEAQFIVEQQVKQLRDDLTREAAEAAIGAAEALLTKSTTSFDQQRLAQEYLSALQKGPASAKPPAPSPAQTETRL